MATQPGCATPDQIFAILPTQVGNDMLKNQRGNSPQATMTKLKRKQSKKRANAPSFSINDFSNVDLFADFLKTVNQSQDVSNFSERFLWCVDALPECEVAELQADAASQLIGFVKAMKKKSLPSFLSPPSPPLNDLNSVTIDQAIQTLVITIGLAKFCEAMEPSDWLDAFHSISELPNLEDALILHESPVVHQILFAEVPLLLSVVFPQLDCVSEWIETARNNLAMGIEELLDGEGLPASQYVLQSHLLLACWTRCQLLAASINKECFDTDSQTQFRFFVRQTMRLTRKDGSLVFSSFKKSESSALIFAALNCYSDEDDQNLAKVVLPKIPKLSRLKKPSLNALPETSTHSEWSELAVLQTEWTPRSPRLTVSFENKRIVTELSCGGVLFSGAMCSEILLESKPIKPLSEWEVVCWHSDQDGDFLELECQLPDGLKWQKHFLLTRNDLFLLTGDAFLGIGGKQFDYQMSWPLSAETRFGLAAETNEKFLIRKAKSVGAIIPITMPEWKVERSTSAVSLNAEEMKLQMESNGSHAYFPVFMDLDPKRCRKPLTWRRLTVAEKLVIQGEDVACGYRIQVGDQQWLVYRSLAEKTSRTVLGQNLSIEFYVGALEADGTCAEIISID